LRIAARLDRFGEVDTKAMAIGQAHHAGSMNWALVHMARLSSSSCLQEQLGLTFIIVTHDQQEAMTVASRIGVVNRGALVQVATPPEIYEQPSSCWVADFIGEVNPIEARVLAAAGEGMELASDTEGRLRAAQAAAGCPGDTVWVALRPEKIRISHERPTAAAENCVTGQVCNIGYLGDLSIYKVELESGFVMKAALASLTRLIERPVGGTTTSG